MFLSLVILCAFLVTVSSAKAAPPAKSVSSTTKPNVNQECEKRVPSSFTAAQKKQLCTSVSTVDSTEGTVLGPALCASMAKQLLHGNIKFDTILQLCQGASSSAPVQCYNNMDKAGNTLKTKYGLELCSRVDSTLPGECFAEINSYTGTNNKLKPEMLFTFCQSLEDRAPLLCMNAVKQTNLLPIPQALELCADVIGSGSKSSSEGNNAVAMCIEQMQTQVKPSFGVTALDVLKFCIQTNPASHFEHQSASDKAGSDESESSKIEGDDTSLGLSAPAECYIKSAAITQATPMSSSSSSSSSSNSKSNDILSTGTPLFTPKQRLSLCANAYEALGPVNCTLSALYRVNVRGGAPTSTGLKAVEVIELCQGARGTGPADCFAESRSLGSNAERTHLCNGASSAGPAHCYRRAANVFKSDMGNRSLLCVSALSEDPALCAIAAPHYLSIPEKVELCGYTPPLKGQDSIRCLAAVEAASKQYRQAPKKALGYFLESLWDARDRKSRELLLHMCSFAGSQDPLASADCFKSAPNSLDHDDAARMCTDIPSTEVIQHMQLCHRLLPGSWESEEASLLCELTTSREQVEAALKCAVEASTRMLFPKLSRVHAAQACTTEQSSGPVLACLREVNKGISASSVGAYIATPETVVAVCSAAGTAVAEAATSGKDKHSRTGACGYMPPVIQGTPGVRQGVCLAKLASTPTSRLIFDAAVPAHLCALPQYESILVCLDKQNKRMVTVDDVTVCVNTKQQVKTMRVKRILTEDNDIQITAGKRFSLWLELLDQYGRHFEDPQQQYQFTASLNANNPQGAILWGMRSNYTSTIGDGILQFNSLVITQPGDVEFKISIISTKSSHSGTASKSETNRPIDSKIIEIFHMKVLEDPIISQAAPCVYTIQYPICPIDSNTVSEWESEFPRIRSYTPGLAQYYLRNIYCAGEGLLSTWYIGAHLSADGGLWIEYRLGIDSLWTGIGMPKMEQSPLERLGLIDSEEGIKSFEGYNDNKTQNNSNNLNKTQKKMKINKKKYERLQQKEIKKAYYRKSLQWHPDRWASMPMYILPVQGAFELISDAYNQLNNDNNYEKERNMNEDNDNIVVVEPMFE